MNARACLQPRSRRSAADERRICCFAAVATLALCPGIARADDAGAADYTKGMELFRAGDCKGALPMLEAATVSASRPPALKAMAHCYRQGKRFSKARRAYERYLETHPDDEEHVRSLLEQTMEEERMWRHAHPGERESDDALAEAPLTPPPAPAPAATPARPAASAAPTPTPAPKAATHAPAPVAAVAAPAPQSQPHTMRVVGWSLIGVSIAGAGVGTIFGLGAKSSTAAWGADTNTAAYQSDMSSAQSKATIANVAWISAGVLAAAGLTLVLIDR